MVAKAASANDAPIADAGSSRYAAQDPIVLDGTGSYDPDSSGALSYTWQQTSGPTVVLSDADTATPAISGFVQTDEIQECEFELVVSDGELTSPPDTVKVKVVPDFGASTLVLGNPPFDPDRPTIIYFGGGDCVNGGAGGNNIPILFTSDAWLSTANIINFPNGYTPDGGGGERTYYKYGDMIIAYLSAVAPDYQQPIQTVGVSTGGQPTVDVGIHLNLIYADARYAVNHVTFLDALTYCRDNYSESITTFLGSSVDGEQCWADAYVSTTSGGGTTNYPPFHENVLNVWFPDATGTWYQRHVLACRWYEDSLELAEMNDFNHGVVAGAYWSVVGPGKNLQLASTPGVETYRFTWHGDRYSGYMDLHDEAQYPGRLPEPVTLWAWRDDLDSNSVVLTCKESANAVGYEVLLGSDPYRIVDYSIISDTATTPRDVTTDLPFEETWWTVRARDQHGSTIYADPMLIDLEKLPWPTVENLTTGQTYGYIQAAIDHAAPGDEIVVGPGTYQENIIFKTDNLTLTSADPNDPTVVAATVINGVSQDPVVTLPQGQGAGCVLAGLTITGGTAGVSCGDASPTIRNCTIESTGTGSIEFLYQHEPTIIDCIILGSSREVYEPSLVAFWKMDETAGSIAHDSAGLHDGTVMINVAWQPDGGKVGGALEFDGTTFVVASSVLDPSDGPFSVLAWVKGGAPGQALISQVAGVNWLMADELSGTLMTELRAPTRDNTRLVSETVITDGDWHRVAFVWDGVNRMLYADAVLVASDIQSSLGGCAGSLIFGRGSTMIPGTSWAGLIDDVRIYNRAVKP